MRILLFGKNGQLGWELTQALAPLGDVISLGRNEIDFTNIESVRNSVKKCAPDIIVNAAAYTAVDKAESNYDQAYLINAEAVRALAEEALCINAFLVHYSTDYVFNGQKELPYTEEDLPNPLNIYGQTKLKGEQFIQESGCRHLIFRTNWVFGIHGENFVKTILKLAKERKALSIVGDQIGSPTAAKLIANVTSLALYKIINDDVFASTVSGIYNLSSAGKISWYEFAVALIQYAHSLGAKLSCESENVKPITSLEYPLPAKRPGNSILNTTKLQKTFNLSPPSWEQYAYRVVEELIAKGFI